MNVIRDRLSQVVGRRRKVFLERRYPGDPHHTGFVLDLGRELVLVHQFHDFFPDGYTALRIADIKRVRSGEQERFWEKMLRGEGLLDQVGIAYDLPCDDFRSLLSALHAREQHVIVECEDRKDVDRDEFFIGVLLAIEEDIVFMLPFDVIGEWYDEPIIITLDTITKVQFDTPYANTFRKYLKPPLPWRGGDPAP
jgi:hypothetical protein